MFALACLGALLLVLWLDRRERTRLVDVLRAERDSMFRTLKEERTASDVSREQATAALVALIADLCQRVQAPEQAVVDHTARTVPLETPEAVNPESDDSYWQAQGLTTEQLAELAYAEELAG